jgi:hypothetical protein
VSIGAFAALLAPSAHAYETDQLTLRAEPLADVLAAADAKMDELLDLAADATNEATACAADRDSTQQILAREIYRLTAKRTHVDPRGFVRGFGFGRYSGWLETAVAGRSFDAGDDVFGDVGLADSVIVGTVGTCSTVNLGGVLVGTDKIDHFLTEGYHYAVSSRWGRRPERGIRYGTRTENTIYGRLTSQTFSYADLRANWDGYLFYVGLLDEGSVLRQDEDGCVERVADFGWSQWVDWQYDEVYNPPVFTNAVQDAVSARLAAEADAYCESWDEWGPRYLEHVDRMLVDLPGYAGPRSPDRTDPWGLAELCGAPGASVATAGD